MKLLSFALELVDNHENITLKSKEQQVCTTKWLNERFPEFSGKVAKPSSTEGLIIFSTVAVQSVEKAQRLADALLCSLPDHLRAGVKPGTGPPVMCEQILDAKGSLIQEKCPPIINRVNSREFHEKINMEGAALLVRHEAFDHRHQTKMNNKVVPPSRVGHRKCWVPL